MKYTPKRKLPSMLSLQAFESAARHASFTRAGEELSLSQSAVSRQVATLEEFLATPLFARVRQRLLITEAGTAYVATVRTALEAIESATLGLRAHQGAGGLLNISIPSTWGNKWLLPRVTTFAAAHPEITVNLSTKVGAVDFSDGELDAAIVYGNGQIADTSAEFLMPLVLVAVATPALLQRYPRVRAARDLLALPLLHQMTVPDAWRLYCESSGLRKARIPSGPRYALLSMGLQATLAGLGAALLPEYLVEDELRDGRLKRIRPHTVRMADGYYFHVPLRKPEQQALRVFRSWLREAASAESATANGAGPVSMR